MYLQHNADIYFDCIACVHFIRHTGVWHTQMTHWKMIVNKYLTLQLPRKMPWIYWRGIYNTYVAHKSTPLMGLRVKLNAPMISCIKASFINTEPHRCDFHDAYIKFQECLRLCRVSLFLVQELLANNVLSVEVLRIRLDKNEKWNHMLGNYINIFNANNNINYAKLPAMYFILKYLSTMIHEL